MNNHTNWNKERLDYIDPVEEEMMGMLYGSVLDIGCGSNARSALLIARNPHVNYVTGFDPEIPRGQQLVTEKTHCTHGFAEKTSYNGGHTWIVSMYSSIDYILPEATRDNVIRRILETNSKVMLATQRRFMLPNKWSRIKWNLQALFNTYLTSRQGLMIVGLKQYQHLGLRLIKKTSNKEYWVKQ